MAPIHMASPTGGHQLPLNKDIRVAHRRISFTTFMDFVTANGQTKLSRIRTALSVYNADEYRAVDYYLDLRHAIGKCFGGEGVGALDACLKAVEDERKGPHYGAAVAGLKKWIGRKKFERSFVVPPKVWVSGDLSVSVRPELGLVLKGEPLVIKLYLKDEPIDQHRVNPLLHLMRQTHGTVGTVAILDVRRGKLFKITRQVRDIDAFLAAEAQYFVSLWNSLAA
jgi:hypothetical protein